MRQRRGVHGHDLEFFAAARAARSADGRRVPAAGMHDSPWQPVARGIEGFAKAWSTERTQACLQHQDRSLSTRRHDLLTGCLEEQARVLDTILRVLVTSASRSPYDAATAIARLPDPAACRDFHRLEARIPPPARTIASEVDALEDALLEASVQERAGAYAEADRQASSLIERADALAYPPILARALLLRGRVLMQMDPRSREAITALERAMLLGMKIEGLDALAVEAFARLAYVQTIAGWPTDADATEFRSRLGLLEAYSQRLDRPEFAPALLYNNIGAMHMSQGDREQAREYFARAVKSSPAIRGEDRLGARPRQSERHGGRR